MASVAEYQIKHPTIETLSSKAPANLRPRSSAHFQAYNSSETLSSKAPASIKNTVGSYSWQMPTPRMATNLLAPPTHAPCRAYNGRAKSNHPREYEKEMNFEAIIYGYLNDESMSSLVSSGKLRITIPIQVYEGDLCSRPSISSKCSDPFSSLLSSASNEVNSASVKMNTSSIQIPPSEYFISIVTPGLYATKKLSLNHEGQYHTRSY